MSVKTTGWIRDGHTITISRPEEDECEWWVNHPESCARKVEEIDAEKGYKGLPFRYEHFLCVVGYEDMNVGIGFDEDYSYNWYDEDGTDPRSQVGVGSEATFPIEYMVTSGYDPYYMEYEWEFTWRVIIEGRDEGLASDEDIEWANGHPAEEDEDGEVR